MTNASSEPSADAAIARADALETDGDLAGARAVLADAVRRFPTSARTRALYGRLLYMAEEWNAALAQLDAAIRMHPNAPSTLFIRAQTKEHLADLDGALADYAACFSLQPTAADALMNMGMIHEYRGHHRLALEFLRRARESATKPLAGLDRRIAKLEAGQDFRE